MGGSATTTWKLLYEPREWQREAFKEWQEQFRGVVSVVTGGGKTVFAEMCLLAFFERFPHGRALIIVPTTSLQDQWFVSLQDELGIAAHSIGMLGGGELPRPDQSIVIAVINSARSFTAKYAADHDLLLIVDECHRAGSAANARALAGQFKATLGLSATPVREYDEGFAEKVEPALGPIIYEYTYRDAADDKVISPFELLNVQVDLLPDEQAAYDKLSGRIRRIARQAKTDEIKNEALKRLLQRRAAVSATAAMRVPIAAKLVDQHRGERCVVFHERVDAAEKIAQILRERGHRATIYHAGIGADLRRDNLRLFRRGVFDVLVCCRALDEGINVPEASVAVVASGTASQRQRIQRLGRILRTSKGKDLATIYTLFATKEEQERLQREAQGLEGTSQITWLAGRVRADA